MAFDKHDHAKMHQGLVPTSQLGSGTASSSTFLRGDQTWATPVGGGAGDPLDAWDMTVLSVIRNECFFQSTTTFYEGGIIQAVSGTGAGTQAITVDAPIQRPGVIGLSTGTTTTGRCALTSQAQQVRLDSLTVRFGCIAKIDTNLSDGTNDYFAWLGWSQGIAAETDARLVFRYNHASSSGNWEARSRDEAGNTTTVDTGIAANTNWHRFEITYEPGTPSAAFHIDGSLVATISTNLPISLASPMRMVPLAINKTAGTAARTLWVDAYWYIYQWATARP